MRLPPPQARCGRDTIINNAWFCGAKEGDTCAISEAGCGAVFCTEDCLDMHRKHACQVDLAKRLPVPILREASIALQVR